MRRLGVLGTLVWDTIHPPGGEPDVEDWGGIAYSLCAFEAMAPAGWEAVPLVRVGEDLRPEADQFLGSLATVRDRSNVRTVPEANNRVELFYHQGPRRCERLTGGVSGWPVDELLAAAASCDALYVNMIAGWELDLAAAVTLRAAFRGPVYCDVHSLLLGVGPDGIRAYRPLRDWPQWRRCFDLIQLNEEELNAVAGEDEDALGAARAALDDGVEAILLTLGARGAKWLARDGVRWLSSPARGRPSGLVPAPAVPGAADPTGCGDVWGMSCFIALLEGEGLPAAVEQANALAARCAVERGTSGLAARLAAARRLPGPAGVTAGSTAVAGDPEGAAREAGA